MNNVLYKILGYPDDFEKTQVCKSHVYNSFFKNIQDSDLEALRQHKVLHEKVVNELNEKNRAQMAEIFDVFVTKQEYSTYLQKVKSLENYRTPVKVPKSETSVQLFDLSTWTRPQWNNLHNPYVPKHEMTHDKLLSVILKLADKQNKEFKFDYSLINKQLTSNNPPYINKKVVEWYIEGINSLSITKLPGYQEMVMSINKYFVTLLSQMDIQLLLQYCKFNEKYVFLLLYPYFFQPLGSYLWTTAFPVFFLKANSFLSFLKDVALNIGNIIKHQTALVNGFRNTIIEKNRLYFTLGASSLTGVLVLYNKHFLKDNTAIKQLYTGLGGQLGTITNIFRVETSKVIYEAAKTISTFSNAALAGFLEPKQNVIKNVLENFKKR